MKMKLYEIVVLGWDSHRYTISAFHSSKDIMLSTNRDFGSAQSLPHNCSGTQFILCVCTCV